MVKKVLITIVIIIIFGVGYYLISPLFINIKVDEAVPVSNTADTSTTLPTQKVVAIKSAQIEGTSGHEASGSVRIVSDGADTYVRYENFKTINGPDIYIYLAKDLDAKDFVNLGKVKATEGNINYKIPTSVNIKDYRYVMVCIML